MVIGEGTIYYSEKLNKWVGQFTAGRKANGKINRKSVYGNTRKEVKEKITKSLADVQSKSFIEKNDMIFINLTSDIINEKFSKNLMLETSYKRKLYEKKIIEKLPIANMKIQDISISDINNSLSEITNYSNSTIDKIYSLMSNTLNKAVLLKIIPENYFNLKDAIVKPKSVKITKKVEALTTEEQKLFLNELNKNYKYKDVFLIALYTGMRIGEVLALTKNDINLDSKTININKTLTRNKEDKIILGKTTKTYSGMREIPFSDILLSTFTNLLNNSKNFLFIENNSFINPATINSHFKRICKNANIKLITKQIKRGKDKDGNDKFINLNSSIVNTHMLRHTFATRCIEAGMSAVVLQKILGHNDIETTLNTYTSVFNRFKEDEFSKFENYIKNI